MRAKHRRSNFTPRRTAVVLLLIGLILCQTSRRPAEAGSGLPTGSDHPPDSSPPAFEPHVLDTEPETRKDTGASSLNAPATGVALPAGASDDWWTTVQRSIRDSEYHVARQEQSSSSDPQGAYQAPNRAHNLRTTFSPQGIHVVPRTFEGEDAPWEWRLSLVRYRGAGSPSLTGQGHQISDPSLHAEDNRIEYRYGPLTEWYVNDARGLEQGFTLHTLPTQSEAGVETALLELALGGNLFPQLTDDRRAIDFCTAGGVTVLRYGELVVHDATGRDLPASLSLDAGSGDEWRISIRVDVSAATYPIVVDPLITAPNWHAESNQTNALLGWSVASAGDVNNDGYDDVIVGAPDYVHTWAGQGAAFVYHGSVTGLSITPTWSISGTQARTYLGSAVSAAGDVNDDGFDDVVVGAHSYTGAYTDEGRAYVYHGSPSGLLATPNWTAEGDQESAGFGCAVGTAGDVNGDGYADVIVGARLYNDGTTTDEGAAYVYHGSGSGLSSTANWSAEGNQDYAEFGNAVGTAGDVNGDGYDDVIVGAQRHNGGQVDEGRAYVYHGSGSGLSATANWTGQEDMSGASFGRSVGTAGDVNGDGYDDVIVGASGYSDGPTAEGWAFVYHGSASGLATSADWTAESNSYLAYLGTSVGTAGDVNGDGYDDVIVGASGYDGGQEDEGRAYVFVGSAAGLANTASWTAEGDHFRARFGAAVSTAGDVNGDG